MKKRIEDITESKMFHIAYDYGLDDFDYNFDTDKNGVQIRPIKRSDRNRIEACFGRFGVPHKDTYLGEDTIFLDIDTLYEMEKWGSN